MNNWLFADSPNVAVLTVRQIIEGEKPVLYVHHDADDGTWQFLSGEVFNMEDGKLVTLRSMIERDQSLGELGNLPLGWQAQRDKRDSAWKRCPVE